MRSRVLLAVPVVLVFAAVSILLGRFLSTEGRERTAVQDLLVKRTNGPVKIIRLDSGTAYSLTGGEGWTRVVWSRGGQSVPVVQCVRVRRRGNPLTGITVTLLRLQAPLTDSEGTCR